MAGADKGQQSELYSTDTEANVKLIQHSRSRYTLRAAAEPSEEAIRRGGPTPVQFVSELEAGSTEVPRVSDKHQEWCCGEHERFAIQFESVVLGNR